MMLVPRVRFLLRYGSLHYFPAFWELYFRPRHARMMLLIAMLGLLLLLEGENVAK